MLHLYRRKRAISGSNKLERAVGWKSPNSEVILANSNSTEFLTLTENDQELHRFFDRVRAAGRVVVKAGEHEFVVEHRPATITDEARRLLTRGGPED